MLAQMYMACAAEVSGPEVSLLADGRFNSRLNNICYSGVRLDNLGEEFEYTNSGGLFSKGNWLDSGDAADVWVERIVTSGSWNNLDPGAGRHVLSTSRNFRVNRTSAGTQQVIGYFKLWDAASGGNLLQQTASATWSAQYIFEGCPLCCFTPDTPIAMADGTNRPIGALRKGDMILVRGGEEAVTGIIVRGNRRMFRIHFETGAYIDASDDHPFHADDKGPSSINPVIPYKDIGLPDTLLVGDVVSGLKVLKIEPLKYPGAVYTLENSLFYANGLLVY